MQKINLKRERERERESRLTLNNMMGKIGKKKK